MATWSFTAWNNEIPIEDHETTGLSRLLAQYGPDNAPRLRAFLSTFLECEASIGGAATAPTGAQSLEDLAYQMLALRSIYTATGVNLDNIGRLVGLDRTEYSATDDEIYRMLLLVKILVNRSEATWEEINTILVRLGLDVIEAHEYWPATMSTAVAGMPADPAAAAVWDVIKGAKAGGGRWDFLWSTYDEEFIFRYSSQLDAMDTDVARGFSDAPPATTGGRIMGHYQ